MDVRMYEKRFGLHRKPFQSVLTDHDFFQSETIHEILPAVLHALKSDLGVAVLTGPSGVGKSVTLDHLRRSLESSCQTVLIRGGTVHCAADLLFLLQRKLLKCQTQDADTSSAASSNVVRRWEVVERLERIVSFWGPLIVLLDDAHLVQPDVFAELRALLEEDFAGQKLLRLLIAGPLLLEEVLAEPNRVDFVQKIRTHVFLQPLRSSEAVAYLNHHLTCAGASLTDVMDSAAVERIVVAADGIPRCLNLLADECLMVCDENAADRVTRGIVDQALARLQHLPYAWNVSLHETHEHDSMELDQPESAASTSRDESTNHGVTEMGVFEIGEPASPTQSANRKPTATVLDGQDSRNTVTMEGRMGCIEIGGPSEPSRAQLPQQPAAEYDSESAASAAVQNIVAESEESKAVAAVEETWTEALSLAWEADLSSGIDNTVLPQLDQASDEADTTWTATEVTAEEFFKHQETLADFDDSDDAIVSPLFSAQPLFDQTPPAAHAGEEQPSFENQNTCDTSLEALGCLNIQDTQELQTEESSVGEPQNDSLLISEVAGDAATMSDQFLPETDSSFQSEATEVFGCGLDVTNEPQEIVSDQTTQKTPSISGPADQESDSSNSNGDHNPAHERHVFELLDGQYGDTDDHVSTTNSVSAVQPGFETFQPWQPAGTWPAATVARPVAVDDQSTAINVLPVYDRYTWCELGRSVSPSQRSRQHISLPLMSCAQWPPLTRGIAPEDSVPVVDLQDDYAELLTDLGTLIDATSDTDGQTHAAVAVRDDLFLPGSDQDDAYTSDDHRNPESALDRIQQLLESERSDQPATQASVSATGSQEAASQTPTTYPSADDNAAERDLLAFDAGNADSRGWSLVNDSQGQTGPGSLSFLNEIFDAAQRPDPSTFDAGEFAPEGPSESDDPAPSRDPRNSGTARRDVSQDDPYPLYLNRVVCDDDRDVSLLDESQLQNEDDHLKQQQHLPQLLRQARQRIATHAVHGGQLRHAAGAESVSAVTDSQTAEAASPKPRLSISSVADEEEEPQSAIQTSDSTGSTLNFRNLFTRLRQRDKRA